MASTFNHTYSIHILPWHSFFYKKGKNGYILQTTYLKKNRQYILMPYVNVIMRVHNGFCYWSNLQWGCWGWWRFTVINLWRPFPAPSMWNNMAAFAVTPHACILVTGLFICICIVACKVEIRASFWHIKL